MHGVSMEVERDASGRFVAGQSGNPAGKKPGTKNRKTILMAALADGEGEAVARIVIDKALAGDVVAARFVVSLISPRARGRTIQLEMPADDDCNVVAAYNATLRALCEGEITPDEAVTVARFLDGRRRVLQAWQLEEKLTSYGRTIPGDPEWADEDAEEDADDEGGDDDAVDDAADEPQAAPAAPDAVAAAPPEMPAEIPTDPGDTAAPPRRDAAGAVPAPQADLLSACISPPPAPAARPYSPGTIRGMISIPVAGARPAPASAARGLDVRFGPA
jgi:hypothetical protein